MDVFLAGHSLGGGIPGGWNHDPQASCRLEISQTLCTGQFQNRPCLPRQTPENLIFLKILGIIPRYVASLDRGQMPHPLELLRGSNPRTPQAC